MMSGAYCLTEPLSEDVKDAISHLTRIFEKYKNGRNDENLWGDEMEYCLVDGDDYSKLSLQG